MRRHLVLLFVTALAIRWSYVIAIYIAMGERGLISDDSSSYIEAGRIFAERFSSLHGFDLLGHNPIIMPLGTWILAISSVVGGSSMPLAYVLMQGVIDAATCLIIYAMATTFNSRLGLPAGIFAAANPTQVVMAGLVYLDVPFVFFVAVFLLGTLRWLHVRSWSSALLIAVGLTGAAQIRVLIVPFALVTPFLLSTLLYCEGRLTRSAFLQSCVILVVFCVGIAAVPLRNGLVYGHWVLTPQSGMHLARWIIPLIWEVRDGTPWVQGYEKMERLTDATRVGTNYDNAFERSDRYLRVAKQELAKIELSAIAKAWLVGAAISVASPAIIVAPPVQTLPRTGFYRTTGDTTFAKIWNFLFRSESALYTNILLMGAVGVAAARLLQFVGFISLSRKAAYWPGLLVSLAWLGFVLTVNGPVASPKYRLPMEPVLMVLSAAGFSSLRRRLTVENTGDG
jgi:hypothetical protein